MRDIKIKKFTADNGGVVIDTLTASCNQATLKMSLRHAGFDANNPMWLHAEVEQLELDRQLLGVLPEALQEQWQKYRPIGVIDADLTLEFDGRNVAPGDLGGVDKLFKHVVHALQIPLPGRSRQRLAGIEERPAHFGRYSLQRLLSRCG